MRITKLDVFKVLTWVSLLGADVANATRSKAGACSAASTGTTQGSCVPLTCSLNNERIAGLANTYNWNKYEGTGVMFKDKTFGAGQSSLYWDSHVIHYDMVNIYKNVQAWKRPSELMGGEQPSLWGAKGVGPDGVVQGELGDCWFLAAAAALAEYPERITRIFKNTEYSAEGIFQVRFWKSGRPVWQVVDDRIPVTWDDTPINSDVGRNGAWWLIILEKAYAKFNVNYANINGGDPAQALRELSGMPVATYLLQ